MTRYEDRSRLHRLMYDPSDYEKRGDHLPRGSDRVDPETGQGMTPGRWSLDAPSISRREHNERLYGVTLRHENTGPYRSSDPGNFYQEGPGRGKGKIVSSTNSPAGKFSMRHKYQAKISNALRRNYGARDSIGGSYNRSGHGTHTGDVSMHNPPDYR